MALPPPANDYELSCTPAESQPSGHETPTAWLYTPWAFAALTSFFVTTLVALGAFCAWALAKRGDLCAEGVFARCGSAVQLEPDGCEDDAAGGDDICLLPLRRTRADGSAAAADDERLEEQAGLTDAAVGRAVLALVLAASAALLVLQVNGVLTCVTEALQARRLALFNATCMFCLVWFGVLSVPSLPSLRNAFRVPCALADAETVQVTVYQDGDLQAAAAMISGSDAGTPCSHRWPWRRQLAAPRRPRKRRVTLACPVQRNSAGVPYITVLGMRRVFDAHVGWFIAPTSAFHKPSVSLLRTHADGTGGLSDAEAKRMSALLGRNEVNVPVSGMLAALGAEFLQLFYVYQFLCCELWAVDHYMAYAYTLCASILFTGVANVTMLRRTHVQLHAMADFEAEVWVRRGGTWCRVSSRELVPGDVIRLEEGRVPCDAALVSGRPAVDESMLTGESLPVTKTPLLSEAAAVQFEPARHKRHAVFAGTVVLSVGDGDCLAVVTHTGLATSKGQLLQSLMFPSPLQLHYETQVRVVLGALLVYAFATFAVTIYFFKSASFSVSVMFGLESLATVIPPLLPLALAVGQSVASDRLRRRAIFCLSLPRIALAGSVDVMCFDKTGTLTRDGLDFVGVHPVDASDPSDGAAPPRIGALLADASAVPPHLLAAMASATSLSRVGTRMLGNEVDCKLFAATGWQMEDGSCADASSLPEGGSAEPRALLLRSACGRQRLRVLRRFEFDHGLQCMSVLVSDASACATDGSGPCDVHVFVKGSYERLRVLASAGAVPANYDAVTAELAKQGSYVLALGCRSVQTVAQGAWHAWSRADVERDLRLLGLLVFRNELKPDTPSALAALAAGGVTCTMITGDNAFTGVCVARAAGLLDAQAPVALAEERGDADDEADMDGLLAWRDVDSGRRVSETALLAQLRGGAGAGPDGCWCELALSGGAFAAALRAGTADSRALLLHARVFARMSPDQKTAAVDVLKAAGLVVGMCGDGGNDCGALRAAHVGIALSEAEASLVSPFASKRRTVAAVVDVLQEGRASLATSFASLKYMVQYGLLYSVLNLCVNYYLGSLSQAQYVFIDMAIILPLSAAATLSGPAPGLHVRRPTTDLLGPHTLFSLLGQFALCVAFTLLALTLLTKQPWYVRRTPQLADPSRWWLAPDSAEVSVLFLVAVHQFCASAVAFSLGSVFRAGAHTNWPLCATALALNVLFAVLVLWGGGPAGRWFHLVDLPSPFRVRLWLLLQVQTLSLLAWEKALLDGPAAAWGRAAWDRITRYSRPGYLRLPRPVR